MLTEILGFIISGLIFVVISILSRSSKKLSKNPEKPTSKTAIKTPIPETEEEKIKRKIESLKKQAEDKKIYEKSLEILSFYNKNKDVFTFYYDSNDDLANEKENERLKKAGIITCKKNNLIIENNELNLTIINKGKIVFGWTGFINAATSRYNGLRVYAYIPGEWEKDFDQLYATKQEEKKKLKELTEKQIKKEERERWGL